MDASVEKFQKCFFCKYAQAKYTCPRCECQYCSVKCYNSKEHLQCTERFYEDCVRSHIKSEQKSEDAKNEMFEALKRTKENYEENNDDDEEDPTLEERIKDLNLSGDVTAEELWDRLTEKEKEHFKRIIDSGEALKLMSDWQPWWIAEEENKIIDITDGDNSCASQSSSNMNVKPLSLLTSKIPSSCIKYNFLNIIYGYVYTVKIHCGSHHDFPEDAVDVILYLSPVLHKNVNFESVGEAVQYCIQKLTTKQSQWTLNRDAALVLVQDVSKVVATLNKSKLKKSVSYVLEDLHSLFKRTKANLKKSSRKKEDLALNLKMLTKVLRKLDYYMSWLLEYQICLLQLIPDLDIEYACAVANHLPPGKPQVKKESLIQEINANEKCETGWEELD